MRGRHYCCNNVKTFLLCRIVGTSVFDYKGDKYLEENLLDDCKTGKLCSCGRNEAVCGKDAIGLCFPSEKGKHHNDVNAGTKRKAHTGKKVKSIQRNLQLHH